MRCRLFAVIALLGAATSAFGATLTWTGGGGNNQWSTAANWNPPQVPASGDSLQFGLSSTTFNNDLPSATTLSSVTLNGGTVTGNAIAFTGALGGAALTTINVPVRPVTGAVEPIVQNVILSQPLDLPSGSVALGGSVTFQAGVSGGGTLHSRGTTSMTGTAAFTGVLDVENGSATVAGDMPNADVNAGAGGGTGFERPLIGTGTLRNLTATQWGVIAPGPPGANPGDLPILPGSLTVANLQLSGRVQFVIDSAASQLRVNGTATLGGTIGIALKAGFTPAVGQGFLVVDKLSAGAVSGTFSNAPAEGSTFEAAGFRWSVTYAGGNGNDVEIRVVAPLPRPAASLVWTGAAGDGKWSSANNWQPALAPQAGDSLSLGYASQVAPGSNDLPAYTIFERVSSGETTVSGNALSVATSFGSIDVRPSDRPTYKMPVRAVGTIVTVQNASLEEPLEMTGGQVKSMNATSFLHKGLTGTGSFLVEAGVMVGGTSSFSGTFTQATQDTGGAVEVMGNLPSAKAIDVRVRGTGQIAEVSEANGFAVAPGPDAQTPGTLTIGKLSLAGTLDLLFTAAATSRVKITQSITLSEALLAITPTPGFTSTPGAQYTIVDNAGSGPITGSFRNARHNSVIVIGNRTFRVDYSGGDGNDLVLTDVVCTLAIAPANGTYDARGGTGAFDVLVGDGCLWTATSNASWVTILGSAAGSGNGRVRFEIGVNTSGMSRQGTIQVSGGPQYTITQLGQTCDYSVDATTFTFGRAGGSGRVMLTAPPSCEWSANSNRSWVTVSKTSGSGSAAIDFTVAPNDTFDTRTAELRIGDRIITITVAPCAAIGPTVVLPLTGSTQSSPVRVSWAPVDEAVLYRIFVTDAAGQTTLAAESRDLTTTVAMENGSYKVAVEAVFATCPPTRSSTVPIRVGPSRRRPAR